MKSFLICLSILASSLSVLAAGSGDNLPVDIYSGLQGKNHIQGIAVNLEKGEVYMSFTTSFIKTDMQGRLLGSLTGITGHLGCMALNPQDGKVFASLEYKHDAIGKGIMKTLGVSNDTEDGFYIAIIDPAKINAALQPAETAMVTVEIKEALKDFVAEGPLDEIGAPAWKHRYGCSGIDGVTFAPAFGKTGGKMFLYVAYGIYSDVNRRDNDCQVLLQYDVTGWDKKYGENLTPEKLHRSGPKKPHCKYFVPTGNTSWGLQGLCYDKFTNTMFLSAYPGKKPNFPNWSLFRLNCSAKPQKAQIPGLNQENGFVISPISKENGDICGWRFGYGTTGMAVVGNGLFYISENGRDKDSGLEYSHIHLYHWTGDEDGFKRL